MKVQALTTNIRISPLKLRALARGLVGMPAQQALQTLKWIPRKSARLIAKTLKSAVANGENNFNLPVEQLTVCEIMVDDCTAIKRFQPVSRGSAHPIRKRTSRVKIVLTSDGEIVQDGKE